MSKGYPDFFGQSIFPKYGPMNRFEEQFVQYHSGDSYTPITISGRGVLYSLYIGVVYGTPPFMTNLLGNIDEADFGDYAFLSTQTQYIVRGKMPYLETVYFNPVDRVWLMQSYRDIPFSSGFSFGFLNQSESANVINIQTSYYLIE